MSVKTRTDSVATHISVPVPDYEKLIRLAEMARDNGQKGVSDRSVTDTLCDELKRWEQRK